MEHEETYGLDPDGTYAVKGYEGIAFYICGHETEPDEDTVWSGIENPTGRLLMVMVGDNRLHSIDPEDCTPLDDNDYCSCCGQIGCAWGG